MNHKDIQNQLFAFLDGELSQNESQEICTHLASCADCQAREHEWKRLTSHFFRTSELKTPEHFVENVMAQIQSSSKPAQAEWGSLVRWLIPTFGFVLGAMVLFSVIPNSDNSFSTGSFLMAKSSASLQAVLNVDNDDNGNWLGLTGEET